MGMIFFSKYKITIIEILFNSLRMSDAYMRHQPRPLFVQLMMACRLFGAKPLSEPMLYDCQLDM